MYWCSQPTTGDRIVGSEGPLGGRSEHALLRLERLARHGPPEATLPVHRQNALLVEPGRPTLRQGAGSRGCLVRWKARAVGR